MPRIKYKKLPWKKSFRRIPEETIEKIGGIEGDLVVFCIKRVKKNDLFGDLYDHLDVRGESDLPAKFIPPKYVGRISRYNQEDREIKLKHLPKVVKTFCVEVPNFGDPDKGYHDMCQDREVWQKEYVIANLDDIEVNILEEDGENIVIYAEVSRRISSTSDVNEMSSFINLLQENLGCFNIDSASKSMAKLYEEHSVAWEILPPGKIEDYIERLRGDGERVPEEVVGRLVDRYEFLKSLDPIEFIIDATNMGRYFGAKFPADVVVFENMWHGNAIYIMKEDWEVLSQLSRLEIMKNHGDKVERIVHRTNWKSRVRASLGK